MSKFFVNRPIVAMVISILIVIAGLVSMLGLPVAQFPNIVPPEIMVDTMYVGADQKVDIRPVKVGQQVDGLWVIEQGLQPGESVVVEGLQKVRPGMVVTAQPYAAPATPNSQPKR